MGICETWLSPNVSSSVVSVEGYTLLRNDSPSGQRKHGVCMYVHNDLKIGHVCADHNNTLGVFLPEIGLNVLTVYRPPSNTAAEDQELADYVEEFCKDKDVCIMGDFNLPSINWNANPPTATSARDRLFLETFVRCGLTQYISGATYVPSGRTLDLVLTSDSEAVSSTSLLPPLPGCGHTPITFTMSFTSGNCRPPYPIRDTPLRNWFRGDYTEMSKTLMEVDWFFEFSDRSVEQSYLFFDTFLSRLIDRYVPLRNLISKNHSPWNKNLPNHLKTSKISAWQEYKYSRSTYGRLSPHTIIKWHNFQQVNARIKNFKISSRCQYETELLENLNQNPKRLHSYLRQQKTTRPKIGPLNCDGEMTDSPFEMAEYFVSSFYNVLTSNVPPNPHTHQTSVSSLSTVDFSIADVEKTLISLDPSSSSGPDMIHPLLLKSCSSAISLPLYLLFHKSLISMSVPSLWKYSSISPIFKKGSHADPLNYRPISLTSICSKTMERILANAINEYLDSNNLLSDSQFGFRAGRSVQEQLLLTYDQITRDYDEGKIVELVLFDFSKAFDLVPHSIILEKLQLLGFQNPILGWMDDFLKGRHMRVAVSGVVSSPRPVPSGVPQGSVLGPLLFIIFINYLIHDLQSFSNLFADDLKIYFGMHRDPVSYANGIRSIQTDIDLLVARASSWGLTFAPHKCIRLRFVRHFRDTPLPLPLYLNNTQLVVSETARDLGVTVDSELRFHNQIAQTQAKAFGMSNNILRGTICRSPEFMKVIFISHVRPLLDCCSPVWNTDYILDIKSLESVQRHWTKKINGFSELSYHERLQRLSLFSIWGRLLRADLIMVWKITHGLVPCLTDILPRSTISFTRGHPYKLAVTRSESDARKRFFSNRVVTTWNNLPTNVVMSSSLPIFKSRLHSSLGELLYFYYN